MIGFLEGLLVTLKSATRKPITAQYPDPDKRQKVQERFMGFPALTWDSEISEPYCTGCMVCIRDCPTQCMTAQMKDNPLAAEGKSSRRKIIDLFEINLGRCILCGICVDVCNFDAIEMSHEHELSKYQRDGNRADLPRLLELGKEYQAEVGWTPKQPEKNSGVPKARPKKAEATSDATPGMTKEERLVAARARAAAKREGGSAEATTTEAAQPASEAQTPPAEGEAAANPTSDTTPGMTKEERLAAARARAAANREGGSTEAAATEAAQPASEAQTPPAEGEVVANPTFDTTPGMTKEERLVDASAMREPAESGEQDSNPAETGGESSVNT